MDFPLAAVLTAMTHFGFPLWSIIGLSIAFWVVMALRRALLTLHDADKVMAKALLEQGSMFDKRMALMEQLLARHERVLESNHQQRRRDRGED